MRVTLASASPRRRELIKKIDGLEVEIRPSGESEEEIALSPVELVKILALKKAQSVFSQTGGIVIGADTIVTIDGMVLGKPSSEIEAKGFFRLLCGREHEVITGLAVISENKTITAQESTKVQFNEYDERLVSDYIATGSPFDKAGGYGIQDEGMNPIVAKIEGDMDNVIGLPVKLLAKILEENF